MNKTNQYGICKLNRYNEKIDLPKSILTICISLNFTPKIWLNKGNWLLRKLKRLKKFRLNFMMKIYVAKSSLLLWLEIINIIE